MKRGAEKSPLELFYDQECSDQESETQSLSEEEASPQESPPQVQALSEDQKRALERAKQGMNLFITGNAGSGKSFLIEQIMEELRKMGKKVVLTASTGIAAFYIGNGASTLHAFAGVGLGEDSQEKLLEFVRKRPTKLKLWNATDVLIIDEFSMISTDFFLKLNYIAKHVRGKFDQPFGRIQLICVGDYFQCPSIEKTSFLAEKEKEPKTILGDTYKRFPFQTPLWKEAKFLSIALKKNFRQSNDVSFFQLLENVKLNRTDKRDLATLSTRRIENFPEIDRDQLIKLCPRRALAEKINSAAIEKIQSESHFFKGVYTRYNDKGQEMKQNASDDKKYDRYPADMNLELKVGVEVLLCKNENVECGLVNGSRGRVIGFQLPDGVESGKLFPMVEFENGIKLLVETNTWESKSHGIVVESFTQVPLILRYAMTIHKAQGLTLEKVLVHCDFFENGQGYVALSRVRLLSDLFLEGLDMTKFTTHPDVISFYEKEKLL